MKKLDKKQIPQFAALCVLTAGLAGYMVMHLVAPSRVSAQTRPAAAPVTVGAKPGDAKPSDAKPSDPKTADTNTADAAGTVNAPPPSPTMHDPFAVGYVDPKTVPAAAAPIVPALPKLPPASKQTADTHGLGAMPVTFPGAPALPTPLSSFPARPAGPMPGLPTGPIVPALPTAPAAPLWTVTGVLQGATGDVAILRSGEARRIVHSGDFVDGTYRVTGVTRTSVTLRHGTVFYHLPLGGVKTAPAAVAPGAVPAAPSAVPAMPPVPYAAPQQAAVIDSVIVPNVSPVKVAEAISLGLRGLDGTQIKLKD